jgi:hypothetical protein
MGIGRGVYTDVDGYVRRIHYGRRGMSGKDVANAIKGIVASPSNIKGMWAFDARQGSIITDLSGNGHDITLRSNALAAIDASACSPGVVGSAPYLTFDSTRVWDTPDSDDFSCVEPQAWSTLTAIIPVNVTNRVIFAKRSDVGGATQKEYMMSFVGGKPYYQQFDDSSGTGAQTRYYNTALTEDIGSVHVYGTTYTGVVGVLNQKIYRDAMQIDDTSVSSGYLGMENKSAKFASYYLDAAGALGWQASSKYIFMVFLKELLTSEQITSITLLLRRYAGVAA